MLVSDLAAVNWLWSFIVLDQIYGRSNFGHKFCLLALLAKFMTKIWVAQVAKSVKIVEALGSLKLIRDKFSVAGLLVSAA